MMWYSKSKVAKFRAAQDAWKVLKKRSRKKKKAKSLVVDFKKTRAEEMRLSPTSTEKILRDALFAECDKRKWFAKTQALIGPYIADFLIYAGKSKIVVEADGPSHDDSKQYDARRDYYMWGCNFRVIRFKNAEIKKNVASVIAEIVRFASEVK